MSGTAVDVLGGTSSPGVAAEVLDGLSSAVAIKGPCQVATTANVTLAGEQPIDGVLTAASRVLVRAQTDSRQNGIYVTSAGDWRRSADFSSNNDLRHGTQVLVVDGLTLPGIYYVTTADPIVVDTSAITFSSFTPFGPVRAKAFSTYVSLPSRANLAVYQVNPTLAAGDVKVSKDGGAFTNITTLPVVTPAGSSTVLLSLSAAEMTASSVVVKFADAAGAEWVDVNVTITTGS